MSLPLGSLDSPSTTPTHATWEGVVASDSWGRRGASLSSDTSSLLSRTTLCPAPPKRKTQLSPLAPCLPSLLLLQRPVALGNHHSEDQHKLNTTTHPKTDHTVTFTTTKKELSFSISSLYFFVFHPWTNTHAHRY